MVAELELAIGIPCSSFERHTTLAEAQNETCCQEYATDPPGSIPFCLVKDALLKCRAAWLRHTGSLLCPKSESFCSVSQCMQHTGGDLPRTGLEGI